LRRCPSDFKLVLAANRDEYYERPSAPPSFWEEAPEILAGRDLAAGGTWLGITRHGRIAAITNYRDPASTKPNAPSRATWSAISSRKSSPSDYLEGVSRESARYNGFNLLVGESIVSCGRRTGAIEGLRFHQGFTA